MDQWQPALQAVLDAFIKADRDAIFHHPVNIRDVNDYLEVLDRASGQWWGRPGLLG